MSDMTTAAITPLPPALTSAVQAPSAIGKDRASVRKAAEDFEAVFVSQMLQPMFNTVEVDDTFGGGQAEETWRGLLVEEYGRQIVKTGGIGLADKVEAEMLKLQEVANGQH